MLEDQRTLTGGGESVFCIEREPQYYNRWKTYCKTHGLTPIILYELRHTFVSVIKPLVGHSQDMDTEGTYSHAMEGDMKKAANYTGAALEAIMKAKK